MLKNLLILDGERLSYRTLDVEQIGSVYETVMGFNLEVAGGKSIAVKPVKTHGAPATINLEALLAARPKDRAKWLKEQSDQNVTGAALKELKAAETIDDLLTALDKKIQKKVTPRVVPAGAIVLQPSDERRRSGSHYTPRSLTEPIVRTTLEPILRQLCCEEGTGGSGLGTGEDRKRTRHPESPTPSPQSPTPKEQRDEEARAAAIAKGVPHPRQILDLKICDPAMGSGAFLVEACRQLADVLVESWHAHADSLTPNPQSLIPPDEDEVLYARRLVAQRCLYGVDKNPMAVDLAKLSLWLVTLAKDHPFTFLDHSLRHGDSLVGLSRRQIIGFHWEPKQQRTFDAAVIQKRLDRATEARAKILSAREDAPYRDQEDRLATADEALNAIRLTADACVSAFFAGSKKKQRDQRSDDLAEHVAHWYDSGFHIDHRGPVAAAAAELQTGEHPLTPMHWEIEFPEVFFRAGGGFDAFVGNPPFAGKNTMAGGNRDGYPDWLKETHAESHGNADLVAHFFRRTFNLLHDGGALGLIATNTIGQGDTRATGLRWICTHGGHIYHATRRLKWPGQAAVVVSVVHIAKEHLPKERTLDGRPVETITAFLFHRGGHENPKTLQANAGKSFQGSIVLGMGFTFDDTDTKGVATPLAEMHRLIAQNPKNAERIFPYIGGQEVNTSPTHAHHRYVINFGEMSEEEAREGWSDLMAIVEERVKPDRFAQKDKGAKELWWQFIRPRPELHAAIFGLERVLTVSRVGNAFGLCFLPANIVLSDRLVVFPLESYSAFCLLQCRAHEIWSRVFGSTLKDDLMYAPADCFETFPFPLPLALPLVAARWGVLEGVRSDDEPRPAGAEFTTEPRPAGVPETLFAETAPAGRGSLDASSLEAVGREYYEYRADLMIRNDEGLTATYNRFHDPHERSPEIEKLRELHAAMDRAVLEAYGWHDLAETATCEFLLDYEEAEDESGKKSKKKKPWRLRWPDEFRDEVLARLLELNEKRAEEERLTGR